MCSFEVVEDIEQRNKGNCFTRQLIPSPKQQDQETQMVRNERKKKKDNKYKKNNDWTSDQLLNKNIPLLANFHIICCKRSKLIKFCSVT